MKLTVFCEIYFTHSARSKLRTDFVAAQMCTCGKGHRKRRNFIRVIVARKNLRILNANSHTLWTAPLLTLKPRLAVKTITRYTRRSSLDTYGSRVQIPTRLRLYFLPIPIFSDLVITTNKLLTFSGPLIEFKFLGSSAAM